MDLDQIIDNIYPLTTKSKILMKESIIEMKFPKGHVLFKVDKVETSIYFIKKGIARAYAYSDDNQITFWLGKEGDPVVSMKRLPEHYTTRSIISCCVLFRDNPSEFKQDQSENKNYKTVAKPPTHRYFKKC